ncbi:unnamed protein product [Phaedon cochleariae]|uniref:Bardet-Biedl syndrome 7 protein n=1 Tax=Phaedon cochleariae TaxID=80249 RepID=A0A9P0DSE6_PHACE|nr:unnamed protein product [Phaedon cochleariae]
MDSYDLNGSGMKQVIIGRQDGNIEVYQVDMNDEHEDSRLIFTYNCNESVTSLQCGIVGSHGFDEIVVGTYTGRIFGLTTQTLDGNLDNSTGSYISTADTSQKIFKLKADIDELKTKIIKERERYQQSTTFSCEVSAIPLLMVKDSFILDRNTSTYNLSIEVPTAIDNILLQCDTEVDLVDVDKNSAVISYSDTTKQDSHLLATYRCQINTNSLKMKIGTIEGKKGTLQAYVTPLVQPKCSRVMRYDIKALSLHYRLHQFDNNRPFNVLTIKGPFSLAEIHSWIGQCLPEVPEKPTVAEKTELWFGSTLLNTILECTYQKGEAVFKSDNVSTISILKDNLTSEATKKKIKVDIKTQINDESVNFVLRSIEEKLLKHQKLAKDLILLNALNELEVTEEETTKYLSGKYRNLLSSAKEIRKQADSDLHCLQRYYGAIEDLYISYSKFKGLNPKPRATELRKMLENYSYENTILFFRPEKTPSC